jgi:hypothetical protein
MSVQVGNKKRSMRKKCVLFIGLLALSVFQVGAERKPKESIGVYSGWSFGLGDVFIDEDPDGHTLTHYMPNFILGAYWQHDFSGSFGLPLNMNHQECSNHWEFNYWTRHEEGTESIESYTFSLNGVFNYGRSAMVQFYILGGIGIYTGAFDFGKSMAQFSGGTGVKLQVRPGSLTSINLAAVFHHLLRNKFGEAWHVDYFRLQAGLEFLLKNKRDNLV